MSRLGVLLAAALCAVALVVAPGAGASRFLKVGIFDDAQVLYGNPDEVFPTLQDLGTQVIRVNLWWGGPNGVATSRPARAADPADRAYDWTVYDRTVQVADALGMDVMFSIVGTPPWANKAAGFNVKPARMADLRNFARAAAQRYDGTYPGPDAKIISPVRYWLAWNEPNSPVFLKPQYRQVRGKWIIQSARDYAQICNAVYTGVKAGYRSAKVACGVTGPRGNNNPNSRRASISPIAFLRAMKAAGAKRFDAYAHHPYYGKPQETPSTPPPPGIHGNAPTAVTLGNIGALDRELRKLYGPKRIWITEYGYQTFPTDRIFGVSWAKQASYLTQAYGIARKHPRIDMFVWFLLQDEARVGTGWQSGLLTATGRKKPAYNAFKKLR